MKHRGEKPKTSRLNSKPSVYGGKVQKKGKQGYHEENSMNIELIPAQEKDFSVVQNLIRFYVYDMSEFMGWSCPESGLYGGVDDQPEYWGRKPSNLQDCWPQGWVGFPYVIRVDGTLGGFVLIQQKDQNGEAIYDVGEFFILRKIRGKGVGKTVAHRIFDQYPGQWEVRQLVQNKPAQHFWRAVISQYGDGRYQESREIDAHHHCAMVVQRFNSSRINQNS